MNKPSEENLSQTDFNDIHLSEQAEQDAQADKIPVSDDMNDYKFIKSKSTGRSHHSSSGEHHHHHHHRRRRRKKMKTWKKVTIIVVSVLLAIVLALSCTALILVNVGQGEMLDAELNVVVPTNVISAEVQDDGDYITYNGNFYRYNKDITSLLFLGVDKRTFEDENEEGTGGQVDVIVMIAIDTKNRKMTMMAVPRDTIAEVALYTPSGHYSGMQNMQISMAYAYGDGKESSCDNTVSSVRRIFYNIPVKTYYALDLNGIAALNDAVGGIDVVSPETIGNFIEGESYHLVGKDAERFVRDRDKSQVDSSLKRLERQKVYAKSFLSTMTASIKKDITSAVGVFNESAPYSCTNLNAAKVSYLAKEVAFGGGMETVMESIPGKISYDGELARYDIDQKAFFEQFLSVYYERV